MYVMHVAWVHACIGGFSSVLATLIRDSQACCAWNCSMSQLCMRQVGLVCTKVVTRPLQVTDALINDTAYDASLSASDVCGLLTEPFPYWPGAAAVPDLPDHQRQQL